MESLARDRPIRKSLPFAMLAMPFPAMSGAEPPAGSMWVGTVPLLRFTGEIRGAPAGELTPAELEQLRRFGYLE